MNNAVNYRLPFIPDTAFANTVDDLAPDFPNVLHADAFCKDDAYILEVAVPGMSRNDVKLSIDGDSLVVEAERKSTRKFSDETQLHSRHYRRSFILPRDVDANRVTASCVHGLLTVTLKRKFTTGRQIPVTDFSQKQSTARSNWWPKLKNFITLRAQPVDKALWKKN